MAGPPPGPTTVPTPPPPAGPATMTLPRGSPPVTAAASRLVLPTTLGGGPKPCSGAVELIIEAPAADGGARTVMLIWRDDFRICTHLYRVLERNARAQTTKGKEKEKKENGGNRTVDRQSDRERERKRERENTSARLRRRWEKERKEKERVGVSRASCHTRE